MRWPLGAVVLMLYLITPVSSVADQSSARFRARLSTVPIDAAMLDTIAGRGAVTAVLNGATLTVNGTFTDLKSAATIARVHRGPRGIRGPAIFDLTIELRTSGAVAGTFELTREQVEDVMQGRFYIQVHSEKAPEGNLWGWLLPIRPQASGLRPQNAGFRVQGSGLRGTRKRIPPSIESDGGRQ